MKKKHTYKAVDIDRIDVLKLLPMLGTVCILAIDVAKTKFVASLASMKGDVLQVFRFSHPKQTVAMPSLTRNRWSKP